MRAEAILREACGVRFTAAVLRVERGGRPLFERAFGAVDDEGGEAVSVDDSFRSALR